MRSKFEPGDIVKCSSDGRGLVMSYDEDDRPWVAFPGSDELTLVQDDDLTLIANIDDLIKP